MEFAPAIPKRSHLCCEPVPIPDQIRGHASLEVALVGASHRITDRLLLKERAGKFIDSGSTP
jgi:hypothetical protein